MIKLTNDAGFLKLRKVPTVGVPAAAGAVAVQPALNSKVRGDWAER